MTNWELYSFLKDFLHTLCKGHHFPKHLIKTMAMMLTGLFLGRHVQLWQMAVCWTLDKAQIFANNLPES